MFRNLGASLFGYVIWTAVFFAGNAVVRSAMPDVHDEAGVSSDPVALLFYLLVSFVASLTGGFTTGKIATKPSTTWVWILGVLLLATGIPVQMGYWDQIPLWYHVVFLAALIPVTLVGGRVAGSAGSSGEAAPA